MTPHNHLVQRNIYKLKIKILSSTLEREAFWKYCVSINWLFDGRKRIWGRDYSITATLFNWISKDSPNECAGIIHVLCEEDNAKERNDHECRNTFLYISLNAFHHMATYSSDKAIFTIYAIIVDDEAICTGCWRRYWRSHIIKLVICECDTVWCRPQHGNTLLMLLRGHDLPS